MRIHRFIGPAAIVAFAGSALATVGDINGFLDNPRLFNDFPNSTLSFNSNFSPSNGTLDIQESNYDPISAFANKHAAWFADANGGNKVDFDYGDGFDMKTTFVLNSVTGDINNVEAGFNADLFGFGLFGGILASGEIAAFGSTFPFHSFGPGLFGVGDAVTVRMIYTPGDGEGVGAPSTMEYMYDVNGGGFTSSGALPFTNAEQGIPSAFNQFYGLGAQIDAGSAGTGAVDISFYQTMIPAPGAAALLGLAGLAGIRRRR